MTASKGARADRAFAYLAILPAFTVILCLMLYPIA